MEQQQCQRHYCYILFNDTNKDTYNGYTIDPIRRLRQHNGEICGGARYTTQRLQNKVQRWNMLMLIESPDFDKHKALSCEWSIKYPTNKRPRPGLYQGAKGRIAGMAHVFANEKFKHMQYAVLVHPSFVEYTKEILGIFPNITIGIIDV